MFFSNAACRLYSVEQQWSLGSPASLWVKPEATDSEAVVKAALSTETWRFSCFVFQFSNLSAADVLLRLMFHTSLTKKKKNSLVLHPTLYSHYHESGLCHRRHCIGWGRILSNINSYNNALRYIISSKTRCCVGKSETAQSLSLHSRCSTKAHDRGVFAQCRFAPQARQTEWLPAGCWWQPLPSVAHWQSTSCFDRRFKSFSKPWNLMKKGDIEAEF